MSCADFLPYFRLLGGLIVLGVLIEFFALTLSGTTGLAMGTPEPGRVLMEAFGLLVGVVLLTGSLPDLLAMVGWGCGPAAPAGNAMEAFRRMGQGILRLMASILLAGGGLSLLLSAGQLVAGLAMGGRGAIAGMFRWAMAGMLLILSGALLHSLAGWLVHQVVRMISRL